MIPPHMQNAIDLWVNHGCPHPSEMGSFLRAVLTNDLKAAAIFADDKNRAALADWALYLYNHVPSLCHGDEARLEAWHKAGGSEGINAATSKLVAEARARDAADDGKAA